ncbi:NAD(P)-binding domain-containing protein, partial [bacterium]|nr:NAD(P)-binding domain-containing protein [bacterium]
MAKVSFIGLGVMGFPMAGHLSDSGHEVSVYNRTSNKSEEWESQFKGKAYKSPREVAIGADFVMACVGNDDDLREICLGENG